jgi:hypothetical protein
LSGIALGRRSQKSTERSVRLSLRHESHMMQRALHANVTVSVNMRGRHA